MQNIKKIISYSMFIFIAQICHYIPVVAIAEGAGVEFANEMAPAFEKAAAELSKAGIEFGSKFGLETTQAVGTGIVVAGSSLKSAAIVAGCSIKSAALAVAAAPATPYILIGAGVIVVSYGGYKVYRIYNPTQEQIAHAAKLQADIARFKADTAQYHAKIAKSQATEAVFKLAVAKAQREVEFKAALLCNHASKRNALGVPLVCQKEATNLAIVAGSKRVEKIVAAFNKHAPQAGGA